MDEINLISLNSIPPLHKGRSFVCYRDVNKAIEKHRELYGLRLALKRAVKLENYCLTIEQMKDLNLRLKYGELDYHCFAATGRPGRPGNDERCPQLIRLKLSADAQSLVVYESHNHNILPFSDGIQKNQLTLRQTMDFFSTLPHDRPSFRGDITLTPINPIPIQKSPVLILPKPLTGNEVQQPSPSPIPLPKNFFINNNSFGRLTPVSEMNSITITPAPSAITQTPPPPPPPPLRIFPQAGNTNYLEGGDNHEKITLRIKKSQVAPNEMVVVGSLRDAQERLRTKGSDSPSLSFTQIVPLNTQSTNPLPNTPSPKPISQPSKPIKEGSFNVSIPCAVSSAPTSGNFPKVISSNLKHGSPIPAPKMSEGKSPGLTLKSGNLNKPGVGITHKYPSPSGSPAFKHPITQPLKDTVFKAKSAAPPSATTTTTTTTTSATHTTTKPTVLKQSPNMKQIITSLKKPQQIGDVKSKPEFIRKPTDGGTGANKFSPKNIPPVVKPQKEVSRSSPVGSIKLSTANLKKPSSIKSTVPTSTSNDTTNAVTTETPGNQAILNKSQKPIQNPKISNSKSDAPHQPKKMTNGPAISDRMKQKIMEKNYPSSNVKPVRNSESSVINGTLNNGNRMLNLPKKMKRKPGRPPDSYSNIHTPRALDTELGYSEKQQLAHGILLQLLKVTSQLPMVEFSHALDTIEMVTDAFRLGQRITLTIRHDEEDIIMNGQGGDTLLDRHLRDYGLVSSTTTDDHNTQPLVNAQVDGQFNADLLLKSLSTQGSILPSERRRERQVERMEVDENEASIDFGRRGHKRGSAQLCGSGVDKVKRIKQ